MNLQQLNQSGQHVWVFVLTAVLALVLTFTLWIIIVLYRDYRQWCDQMQAPPEEEWVKREKRYSFVIRIAILSLTVKIGYGRWLWVSGAWIRILTNERIKPALSLKALNQFSTREDLLDNELLDVFDKQTACDYVCQYIRQRQKRKYFDPRRHLDEDGQP